MDRFIDDAVDALRQYEEMTKRRPLFPPIPVKPASVEPWRPVMTEQQRKEHEQYVIENQLPF